MDRSQRRILRLRKHVLDNMNKDFIQDLNEAYDLAILEDLPNMTVERLKDVAKELGLEGYSKLKKEELIELIEGE